MSLGFVTWDRDAPSGGNTYDRELVGALRRLGLVVGEHRLPGAWPTASPPDRAAVTEALLRHDVSLVDGIVGCGAPEAVAAAVAAGRRVVVLVHMPLAEERGLTGAQRAERAALEAAALRAASAVVVTSRAAAADLTRRHGLPAPVVALPGVSRPQGPARGGGAVPHLLMLAALTPTKDQLTVVAALERLTDLTWTATLAGPGDADPGYADRVVAAVAAAGLGGRVRLPGPLAGAALEREWDRTDLLVLPSRWETYGMAVTEALAHGVPAVVGAGTGAEEALAAGTARPHGAAAPSGLPGTAVPPGDPAALAAVLRGWLADTALRVRWREAALAAAPGLPRWEDTARVVLAALDLPAAPPRG